ncbi:hypothetical protein [Anoxybacterium hadale]|uniref:hypothetical protein n=1 Tax=Anoxybacterium hadale TaxID=3408580 RepID=UPI003B00CBA2
MINHMMRGKEPGMINHMMRGKEPAMMNHIITGKDMVKIFGRGDEKIKVLNGVNVEIGKASLLP